jgi:imidazolonepropionase-like amidohydrolase
MIVRVVCGLFVALRIETGNGADIIAVAGNAVEDVSVSKSVAFVMQGGRIHKAP